MCNNPLEAALFDAMQCRSGVQRTTLTLHLKKLTLPLCHVIIFYVDTVNLLLKEF